MVSDMEHAFHREIELEIERAFGRPKNLIQVLAGPRQVGKTTAARALVARWGGPTHFAAADLPAPPGPEWLEAQWEIARRKVGPGARLLVLDEVQKIRGWAEVLKRLWDEEQASAADPGLALRVLVLGSSAVLLTRGTSESLAGRFYLHRCPHWSLPECRRAFGWDLERWLYHGGYPGAAPLAGEPDAWRAHVNDALIETVLARDVLALQTVAKPALLRSLFLFAARFPAQVLSYNKMLGQLNEAGNTTTLAHYLRLLETAFLLSGLERFSSGRARSRGSSPKLVLWNNALVTALGLRPLAALREDHAAWGRLVENAVGAHLLNHLQGLPYEITYWRERNDEVDYVVRAGEGLWALEVKSGRPDRLPGLAAFLRRHPGARPLIVGTGGMPLEEFFSRSPRELFTAGH